MSLKFYSSVAQELNLKVRTTWELVLTFGEIKDGKLVGGLFASPS